MCSQQNKSSVDYEREEDDAGIFLISLICIACYCIISYYNRDVPLVYNILDMYQYFDMFKDFMKSQLKDSKRDKSGERGRSRLRERSERGRSDRRRSESYETPYYDSSSGYRDDRGKQKKYLFMGELSDDLKEALRVNYINLLYICVFI
jgi:hypothetical protein